MKQAVSEIKSVARKDPILAAAGAVAFLSACRLRWNRSTALRVRSAVNNAIHELVPIVASAPADAKTRDEWLERLWSAHEADQIPYIERLNARCPGVGVARRDWGLH